MTIVCFQSCDWDLKPNYVTFRPSTHLIPGRVTRPSTVSRICSEVNVGVQHTRRFCPLTMKEQSIVGMGILYKPPYSVQEVLLSGLRVRI